MRQHIFAWEIMQGKVPAGVASATRNGSFINVLCSMRSRGREDGGWVRGERTISFFPMGFGRAGGISCVISILSQIYLPIRTTE